MRLLATYQFYFYIPSVQVRQENILVSNQMREGGDLRSLVVISFEFLMKNLDLLLDLVCAVQFVLFLLVRIWI
jgi:hypothetical protein